VSHVPISELRSIGMVAVDVDFTKITMNAADDANICLGYPI
jgi:hypothetical protein